MFSFLAQQSTPLGPIRGLGPLGLEGREVGEAPALFETILSNFIGILTVAGIIWFVFQFLIGAFSWIGSSGDPKQVEAARNRIYNAVLGMIVIFGAVALVTIIGSLLGVRILNIADFINQLTPGQ